MYIPHYDRNRPPEDVNNRDFGVNTPTVPLTGRTPDQRIVETAIRFPDLQGQASGAFAYITPPYQLQACTAKFWGAHSKPLRAQVFLPDHAVMVMHHDARLLISETLWHSHLFFTPHFRNDFTTNWQWLGNFSYSPDLVVTEPVNYCYQRFTTSYFHWFMDLLPKVWFLQKHSPYKTGRKWFLGPLDSPFKRESALAFGLAPENILELEMDGVVEFEDMVTSTFQFEEPLKVRPSFHSGIHHIGWSQEYLLDLRDTILKYFGITERTRQKRYYVSREDAWHRKVRNEAEVIELLATKGFELIVPGNMSFEEQVRTFSCADIVMGPHGAGFTNILWAPAGMELVEFIPEELQDVGYRFTSNMLGQKHSAVACKAFDHQWGAPFSDIEVDLDVLRQVLNHLNI